MEQRIWHRAYDAGVPASLDFVDLPIAGFPARAARSWPDRAAWCFQNASMSYARLEREVERCAAALARLGVEKGTRVAIQLPNLPQVPIAFFAIMRLGAVAVLTNPLYTPREVEHQWNDAGCEVAVVADFLFEPVLRPIRAKLPIRHYVVARIPDYMRPPLSWLAPFKLKKRTPRPLWVKVETGDGVHLFRELVRRAPESAPQVDVFPDDLAVLQYTGGTTGVAKAAMLTHKNLSYNVQQIDAWFTGTEHGREVVMCALPLFHVFGMNVTMNWAVYAGATMVLQTDPRDVPGLIGALERHRVTFFPAVPAMFSAIGSFEGIDRRGISSVALCISGSAPLPRDVKTRFESLTGATIVEGFGLSETSPVTHCNPRQGVQKSGTIGLPVPSTDARIVDVDDATRELALGETGELMIRGPQVMRGYWNRPVETAQAVKDGWLATGDLATMDADGYFTIVGRKKDMILCSGYNVYPDEVDGVLTDHPAVLEAATIGVPDEKRGESIKSFVVLAPGKHATAEELERHCRASLAPYKIPREFEFLPELPKNSVLKVLRRELRERELKKRAAG